jgi:hypothetical protein
VVQHADRYRKGKAAPGSAKPGDSGNAPTTTLYRDRLAGLRVDGERGRVERRVRVVPFFTLAEWLRQIEIIDSMLFVERSVRASVAGTPRRRTVRCQLVVSRPRGVAPKRQAHRRPELDRPATGVWTRSA